MTGSDLQVDSTEPLLGSSRRGRVDSFLSRSIGARMSSLRRTKIARLARYATTSGVAFGVSEATLLILYGSGVMNATVAAVFANLAGTVPSYLMSRYWIWRDAPRTRVARQVALYWATSISCIALTSLSTGAIASLAPPGHRSHLAVVAVGFPVVMITFWFAKFVLYQRVIFRTTRPRHDSTNRNAVGKPAGTRSRHWPTPALCGPSTPKRVDPIEINSSQLVDGRISGSIGIEQAQGADLQRQRLDIQHNEGWCPENSIAHTARLDSPSELSSGRGLASASSGVAQASSRK